ncbi:hypothetical protein [Vibrio mangrovi]|uniref:Uncharacterized protein n=1 Tax=Vibrio mangrovi TaxID=474394 RepID=A0A1Y6INJ2_9VIBR|nr:hypothetical protein [Vibrio mangrovi]MDW6003969.1 hypothetical protein [Vibrio mangrovi]SMR99235.1 hypothetical protein VIM7927_00460 [Vibrio mangrovi]
MNDFWKGVLAGILPTIILTGSSFLFFDIFVERAVVPNVVEQLKQQNYINQNLKEGRYVATTQDAFNKNYVIDSNILINLKNESYALVRQVEDLQRQNNEKLQSATKQYQKIAFQQSEQVALTHSRIDKLQNTVKILNSRLNHGFEVKIYYHNNPEYKGEIQLNTDNVLIRSLLTNGMEYNLSQGNNKAEFRALLRPLKVEGEFSSDPVANLYIDDHKKLFIGTKSSGVGKAYLTW